MTILQLSWFIESIPASLPPAMIFAGIVVGVLSIVLMADPEPGARTAFTIAGIGSVVGMYNFYTEYLFLFIAGITVFAKYIEGLAAVRLYQKALYVLRERDLDYRSPFSLPKRILLQVSVIFAIVVFFLSTVFLVATGYIQLSFGRFIAVLWVFATICYTTLGVTLRFKIVGEEFNALFLPSLILLIAGAEIYDFATLEREIHLFVIGIGGYTLGYWVAVYRFFEAHFGHRFSGG